MHMCVQSFITLVTFILFTIFISKMRDVDEHNMDSYDRYWGAAGEGRTRGAFGTIYDAEGNIDTWRTFTDINPVWS